MIIESHDRRKTVEYFYLKEDEQWHWLIHKNGGTAEENIQSTLDTICPKSVMYEVYENGELAAFFVKYHKIIEAIEGFHIVKEYRNKSFVLQFWEEVKNHFQGPIFIGLAEQNIPAIEHCKRQGFDEVDMIIETNGSTEKKFVVLSHKNKKLCHSVEPL